MNGLKSNKEKVLFLSIWGFICLVAAIWIFRPSGATKTRANAPILSLSPELHAMFASAEYEAIEPSRIEIHLKPTREYLSRMGTRPVTMDLQFSFNRENTVLYSGIAPCRVDPETKTAKAEINNPNRVAAPAIFLYLSH